jgi:hypothetical protein
MGTYEGESIDNSQTKDKLVKEYYRWVRQILKKKLNSVQNQSYQHLSCTSPSLQLWNSQLFTKGNWEGRSKNEKASRYQRNPPPKGRC